MNRGSAPLGIWWMHHCFLLHTLSSWRQASRGRSLHRFLWRIDLLSDHCELGCGAALDLHKVAYLWLICAVCSLLRCSTLTCRSSRVAREYLVDDGLLGLWILTIELFEGILDGRDLGPGRAHVLQEAVIDGGPRPLVQRIEPAYQVWSLLLALSDGCLVLDGRHLWELRRLLQPRCHDMAFLVLCLDTRLSCLYAIPRLIKVLDDGG